MAVIDTATTTPSPRVPLNRDRICGAAVALVEREGLDRLSMRRLGDALGVEAMSLYRHVANKQDLLSGMLDVVATEMMADGGLTAGDAATWREVIARHCTVMHQVLLRHSWAATLWTTSRDPGPVRLGHLDAVLALLRRAGLPPTLLDLAFHALQNHVVGHAMQAVGMGQENASTLSSRAAAFLADFDSERWPDLAAHIRYHVETPPEDDAFRFVLDLILDTIEGKRQSHTP